MKKGFTLVEILVVVAIIVVLAVTVLLILNPITLTEQAYDATRVSDMNTLNKAISLYYSDAMSNPSTLFMGTSTFIYISIPDPSATSTAGDQCQGLNLPAAPTGYTYQCAPSSTYMDVNGTGWIPINFTTYLSGKAGSVISKLPIDPVNQTSSGLYYTYSTDGESNYEVTSIFESAKYKAQYATNVLDPDYPEVDAKGNSLSLSPLFNPSGLVGYWPLGEGSGSSTLDQSGNGANGTWNGTANGANGTYYSTGKVGTYAGDFNGSNDYVSMGAPTAVQVTGSFTISAWIDSNATNGTIISMQDSGGLNGYNLALYYGVGRFCTYNSSTELCAGGGAPSGGWYYLVGVGSGSGLSLYINGVDTANNGVNFPTASTGPFALGLSQRGGYANFTGLMNDVRIYNRALSPAEIQALYDAEK